MDSDFLKKLGSIYEPENKEWLVKDDGGELEWLIKPEEEVGGTFAHRVAGKTQEEFKQIMEDYLARAKTKEPLNPQEEIKALRKLYFGLISNTTSEEDHQKLLEEYKDIALKILNEGDISTQDERKELRGLFTYLVLNTKSEEDRQKLREEYKDRTLNLMNEGNAKDIELMVLQSNSSFEYKEDWEPMEKPSFEYQEDWDSIKDIEESPVNKTILGLMVKNPKSIDAMNMNEDFLETIVPNKEKINPTKEVGDNSFNPK